MPDILLKLGIEIQRERKRGSGGEGGGRDRRESFSYPVNHIDVSGQEEKGMKRLPPVASKVQIT